MDVGRKKVEEVFFDAMLNGWANPDIEKTTLPHFPRSKAIWFRRGNFMVLDWYLKNGTESMGNTIIWEEGIPTWMMSYGGSYPKEAIPFLKEALLVAYQKRGFFGGRGPIFYFYQNDKYVYINTTMRNNFASFLGAEKIVLKENSAIVGFHTYWGRLLRTAYII
ncbi:MAG: DUF5680 domain-containing protein [Patescibacteria group bacterium]|nr:DUF5680 domain-containing protein [Patescibacteria group bacterium]